jgi:MFS transporter, PAT family, beta-lactamase induction signal transducer AmpG
MVALVGMALADPRSQLDLVVWCALAVAFASATQDIALDAYRIESADAQHQGALAATYQTGYRLAMIWAGAGRAVAGGPGRGGARPARLWPRR